MKKQKIVIIGAGPKALNILAKATALEQAGWHVPEIVVLEKNEIGAHWNGKNGYTDGKGMLGISPLKTFNYPAHSIFGGTVSEYLNAYSFTNYLAAKGKLEKWVDGGMGWITHQEFCNYLQWIGSHFADQIHFGEVIKASIVEGKWDIHYKNHDGEQQLWADGLVFTGPGEIANPFALEPDGLSVFDAKNWWKEKQLFAGFEGEIALIGGGISAGAIFESLLPSAGEKTHLDWYTRRGLFTRSENFANNQRFSVPDLWQQIPLAVRKSFISATDRGSLDPSVHQTMNAYSQCFQEVICEIKGIKLSGGKVVVVFADNLCQKERAYDKVILCTGFSNNDYLKIVDDESGTLPSPAELEHHILPDLSVDGFSPKLHLPMLSALKVGIGCATLGSPSVMSDRILSAWATKDPYLEENKSVVVKAGGSKGDSLFATKEFSAGEVVVKGYPTKFSTSRTATSVQVGIDLHMEPSYLFVKANHSCDPNCGLQANEFGGYSLVAMRQIQDGEEITWDYAMSEWESVALDNKKCKCESPNCRNSIGGYKALSAQLRKNYLGFSAPYLLLFQ